MERPASLLQCPSGELWSYFLPVIDDSYPTPCVLSGTVDAAVNGGIKNYESFVTNSYRSDNPEIAEDVDSNEKKKQSVQMLKDCLREQLKLLERGINLHRTKCLESMRPLHVHIEGTFVNMRSELTALLDRAPN